VPELIVKLLAPLIAIVPPEEKFNVLVVVVILEKLDPVNVRPLKLIVPLERVIGPLVLKLVPKVTVPVVVPEMVQLAPGSVIDELQFKVIVFPVAGFKVNIEQFAPGSIFIKKFPAAVLNRTSSPNTGAGAFSGVPEALFDQLAVLEPFHVPEPAQYLIAIS
jgi:hypothetical protein